MSRKMGGLLELSCLKSGLCRKNQLSTTTLLCTSRLADWCNHALFVSMILFRRIVCLSAAPLATIHVSDQT